MPFTECLQCFCPAQAAMEGNVQFLHKRKQIILQEILKSKETNVLVLQQNILSQLTENKKGILSFKFLLKCLCLLQKSTQQLSIPNNSRHLPCGIFGVYKAGLLSMVLAIFPSCQVNCFSDWAALLQGNKLQGVLMCMVISLKEFFQSLSIIFLLLFFQLCFLLCVAKKSDRISKKLLQNCKALDMCNQNNSLLSVEFSWLRNKDRKHTKIFS